MCARFVNGSEQLSYRCSGTMIFPECSSMLYTAPVTNTFLCYATLELVNDFFFLMFYFLHPEYIFILQVL